jgi:hypothetical protein
MNGISNYFTDTQLNTPLSTQTTQTPTTLSSTQMSHVNSPHVYGYDSASLVDEPPSSYVLYKTLVYSFTIPLIFITTVGK